MAVTGDLGGQQITLNNAAQEETLARILAVMRPSRPQHPAA